MIDVINGGRWTTIQDRGRPGLERFGIPPGGAADWFAARVANELVGNPPDAGLIECTATGPALRFGVDAIAAVAGGEVASDGNWQAVRFGRGSSLNVGTIGPGLRTYVAIRGGIDVPLVLGSRSFCQRGTFGGGVGRPLAAGDRLRLGQMVEHEAASAPWPASHRLPQRGPWEVRAIAGPQTDAFAGDALERLSATACRVTPAAVERARCESPRARRNVSRREASILAICNDSCLRQSVWSCAMMARERVFWSRHPGCLLPSSARAEGLCELRATPQSI